MAEQSSSKVALSISVAEKINYACHQSSFSILRDIAIDNVSEDVISDLKLTMTCSPAFVKKKSWTIDRIAPNGLIHIKDRDVTLDGGFLLSLNEAMKGELTFTLVHGEDVLVTQEVPVQLLAASEWGGFGYMPELLAAFVTPNDPAVDRVLGRAAQVLRKANKPDAIDGYNSGSRERVWSLAAAIYVAIAEMQSAYALPPTSFEENGQKIRLPSKIEEAKVATCLDTTLLFAAAFEQAGLNPFIVSTKGHACVGLWLQPDEFSSVLVDSAEGIRQRLPLHELLLIETTYVTNHPLVPFSRAVKKGAEQVSLDMDADFVFAVDVKRARAHSIAPLSLYSNQISSVDGDASEGNTAEMHIALEEAPNLPDFTSLEGELIDASTPAGRLDRWQRKLLDLSARNPLLNHKPGRKSLTFICPDPGELEDMLASGEKITIASLPKLSSHAQDDDVHEQRTGQDITDNYARDALQKKQLLVKTTPEQLDKSVVEIYRQAQTALKESGSNTLFLAIGFLQWQPADKSDARYAAPLILMPVTLERKSVKNGVKMTSNDDEPRFNTTLLELLKKDFAIDIQGLSGALPQDESGIDVALIWNHVRHAVKDVPGFEVTEDVVLGHFSFAKYLMWRDLIDRSDKLQDNLVVKHLLETPRESYDSNVDFVSTQSLDKQFAPSDLLTPLPADSSQMAAIATADRGKDFVIIGPPGTGKSQTIANLIAHMLGKGKKILFVSEKTAALEVVHRRLKDIGLGNFCLELHSNKAKKADVLHQLKASWENSAGRSVSQWHSEAQKLKGLRDQLNRVVDALHKPHPNGLSAHYAIGIKVRDAHLAEKVKLNWPLNSAYQQASLDQLKEVIKLLSINAKNVGALKEHPLSIISEVEWAPVWQEQLLTTTQSFKLAIKKLERHLTALATALQLDFGLLSFKKIDQVSKLAALLKDTVKHKPAFALQADANDQLEALEEAVEILKQYIEAQSQLSCSYKPLAWQQIDPLQVESDWKLANETWWPKKVFAKKKILKVLMANGALDKPDVEKDIPVLKQWKSTGETIEKLDAILSSLKIWHSHESNPEDIDHLKVLGLRTKAIARSLGDNPEHLAHIREKLALVIAQADDLLEDGGALAGAIDDVLESYSAFTSLKESFETQAGASLDEALEDETNVLTALEGLCERIDSHHYGLKEWCAWVRRRNEAIDLQLISCVEALEAGAVLPEELEDVFEAAYCTWWSSAILGEDDYLRRFSSSEHSATIDEFKLLDDQFSDLTSKYIAAKLAGNVPAQDEVKKSDSWGVLRHELQKKTRHKPVRQLLEEVPNVMTSLAPCMMMSPLSVAQFLSTDHTLFDVVIFDEASQITVWDAIGALARGKQVIVAGDPKQMPPTNFFARADHNDDPDVEGDLESILDELIGASIPQCYLNLHYRSRRESLIAFSNTKYYDNNLITFPAPVHPDMGVSLRKVDGFYAKGKARHNQAEAKAIVNEVIARLTSSDSIIRNQSIGVVTFNSEQQKLIEDLLDKARGENPNIEWAFAEDNLESVFVKNLESVQGDERDVILFSIAYGPDESGHMSMNFGPLNRQGGERRLNVAMTRARTEMVVFSTLTPDRIDLSRTQARAVADLKHFLEYAERGPAALASAVQGSLGDFESPFEIAVARALQEKGWVVHPQIGVSAYRIDLGVVHPDKPGIYMAGVECDGAMYHSSAVARERDKIRQGVLEGLGWTLFRIWSTDWWTHKQKALEDIDSLLHAHLDALREADRIAEERAASFVEEVDADKIEAPVEDRQSLSEVRLASNVVASREPSAEFHTDAVLSEYVKANLEEFNPNPDHFYNDEYAPNLSKMITHIIETESPIHEDILIRRIAKAHGFARAGRQIRETVFQLIDSKVPETKEEAGRFLWSSSGTLQARTMNRDDELKKFDYICAEEIQQMLKATQDKGEYSELLKALGIGRLTQQMKARLESVRLNNNI
ncbi:MAG: DNA helicase [Gammaproteobacteria bacterium]|nr:DNA helicase [Gammaproteobacteria bacterium]HBF07992.1 DNA helicase [Gammaproteobacteria bacterium]|tara:strand:- start:693 stop:6545 length:5853 start_codon:yes stop_codon:yes gene_type:complete